MDLSDVRELFYAFSGVGILLVTLVFGADRERKARHLRWLAQRDIEEAEQREERNRLQRSHARLGRL